MSEKITAEILTDRVIAMDVAPEQALEVDVIGAETALELGIRPAVYRGEDGKSPKIGADGCWYVWDNGSEDWISTGVSARGGVSDYEHLTGKPSINGVELAGDKTGKELGLENRITNMEIEALLAEGE